MEKDMKYILLTAEAVYFLRTSSLLVPEAPGCPDPAGTGPLPECPGPLPLVYP